MQLSIRQSWLTISEQLENLSPFWTVFALTLVETVGEGVLAIPIAVAQIGPIAGIAVLVILGVVNILTIAAIAEASARNGSIHYGDAYIGRVVQDYLGVHGSIILGLGVAVVQFQALLSYLVGFSTTLEDALHLPAEFWTFVIFIICFYFLWRGSFDSTVAFALIVGLINISIIILLSCMTLPHVHWSYLTSSQVQFLESKKFDPSVLQLVFGVIFSAYLGHLGVSNSAQVVLRRDTSARSLIWGSMAAQATLMILYCLWVFAVNGAIQPDILAQQSSTALVPLAAELGPAVHWLGSGLIILGIGMSSIVTALGLFCLVRECLPDASQEGREAKFNHPLGQKLFSHQGRFWMAASPILFLFVLVEWQLRTGQESFTEPLSFLGVIAAPLLAGLFPILLLLSSRRKGDRSIITPVRFLGKPIVAFSIYGLFLLNLFVHGLAIWEGTIERTTAIIMGMVMVIAPIIFWARGSFATRIVVEVRQEAHATDYSVVANGQLTSAGIELEHPTGTTCFYNCEGTLPHLNTLKKIEFNLSRYHAKELKVWVHQVTEDYDSEPLPTLLEITQGPDSQRFDLAQLNGQIIVPLHRKASRVKLLWSTPEHTHSLKQALW